MDYQNFSAKTVSDAITEACKALGVTSDKLDYVVVEEGSAGFLGIGVGLFIYITMLCSLKSFGVPYTSPIAPSYNTKGNGYFIPPIWKQEYRASFLSPKKKKTQGNISMKWKN